MGVSEKLSKEVKGIAIMAIVIVVFIIVLNSMRNNNLGGAMCPSNYTIYNTSLSLCHTAGNTSQNASGTSLVTTIGTIKGAIDEPITWIAIIIIIIVVGWLMSYLKGKKGGM
jgi:hypothetical protein